LIIVILDHNKRAYGPFGSTVLAQEWIERQLDRLNATALIYAVYEVEPPVELV
jgi:hypothetical protein